MSTLVLPTNPAVGTTAALRPRLPVGLLALGGGLLAVAGAAAPWLSFFAGLQPISGLAGTSGQLAAALGGVSALIGIVFLLSGRPALRWMLALAGFALLVLAGWSGLNLLTTLPALQADPLLVVEPGPGLPVLAVGGILVLVTLFLPAHGSTRLAVVVPEPAVRSTVTWTLAFAGIVHLAMGPEHLSSALVGGAMIAGGLAQLVLALLVARNRTARWPLVLAVVLQASFVLAYLAA
ncbi:MAG TPA: hypothetical protein VFY23_01115, partial [Candidatus Limnocylindrales bacterium]|nr:hypothetical protein [Candidatus Limnocylindrales bacterium]